MKRLLPFLVIGIVALVTLAIAGVVYREKTRALAVPTPAPVVASAAGAAPTNAPAEPATDTLAESAHVRGPREAPVTLEIYGDFQCPSCAVVSQGIDEIQKQSGGRVRVVFYEFPLEMHPHAMPAALAAEAAGIQGKFWEMHDKLYANQPAWAEATRPNFLFESYADAIGLDVARFRADRIAPDVRARVLADVAAGDRRQVKNTPTVFVNGTPMRPGFTRDELEAAIKSAVPQAPPENRQVIGSWTVNITFANGETRTLRFEARSEGKGRLQLVDAPARAAGAGKSEAATWSLGADQSVGFSGPVEFALGNVGRLPGTLVFKGNLTASEITGTVDFSPSTSEQPAKHGTFKAVPAR